MNQEILLTNLQKRKENLNHIEVLEQVGTLLSLPNTEFYTTEMVAEYYKVGIKAINSLVVDNRQEVVDNGYRVYKKENLLNFFKEFKTKRGGFDILDENGTIIASGSNKGIALFTKRTVLNVGMLLRDSEVAKEIRSRILDIVHDSEKGEGNIDTVIEEVSEEKQLMLDRIEAEMNGDFDKVCVINAKLFAIKNKRIKELENKIDNITIHSLTIEDSKKVINRLVRKIASVEYNNRFSLAWNEFYSKLNYKLNINIKARNKIKGSYLNSLTEEELFKTEEIVRVWANECGIDLDKELKIG